MRTSVPCCAATVAMPLPMKPAPSTPIFRIGLGAGTCPSTPGSRFDACVAKKRKISSRDTSVIAISPNSRASSASPFSNPSA